MKLLEGKGIQTTKGGGGGEQTATIDESELRKKEEELKQKQIELKKK